MVITWQSHGTITWYALSYMAITMITMAITCYNHLVQSPGTITWYALSLGSTAISHFQIWQAGNLRVVTSHSVYLNVLNPQRTPTYLNLL